MSKLKFTDDFESNVRILARRKDLETLDAVYQRATSETLIAIVAKHEKRRPVFRRLRAYGEHQVAARFVEAMPWNAEIRKTIPNAMLPHLKKLAEWQRWNCGLQTYFEIRERERRAKTKRCVAKAA
ncbi:hypothetical protein [Nitrobacter sp. TKz-YC02]|uniref:hypothetical protein n=1 Tax=Nitrobacter sp. TKz-YC02 TaxID=3398704 RepID=UPI003CFBBB8A